MERREGYPNLDLKQSGDLLRYRIRKSGYSVRDIQDYLFLSCPQPVYRWFQGKALPSVDHLYALSRLLGVHMEELLAGPQENPVYREVFGEKRYLFSYLEQLRIGLFVQ
ncbi:helix-turn-helix transcriptional regulator [Ventrimonas sp. CLA-AP-H27]|uniref:Helix-turn-helix transcriptional regulator n=1 Tax=Ventrimonas faecis TaxID=3133170 RepID=A0ABV1HNH1_9FIRM